MKLGLFRAVASAVTALLLGLTGLHAALAAGGTITTDLSGAAGVVWQFQPECGDAKPMVVPGGGWRAQGYGRPDRLRRRPRRDPLSQRNNPKNCEQGR